MCKHCENTKKLHSSFMASRYKTASINKHYSRLEREAPHEAFIFKLSLDAGVKTTKYGLVAFTFCMEKRAVKYVYDNLTAKHLNQLIPVVEEVNALRSALTLLQARLALSDDQILKGIVDDAISRSSTPLSVNELKNELKLFAH
ncbi:TPA: hypothetical protein ACNII0_002932 [Acinetobacter baumannii]|uniref:hypothetical protein n=1 Tax=Acinetobacter baumannii TaxID=470 RepID=UPI0013D3EE8D|nr:hypothetical protein [Acinetobacter baumannii]MDA5045144.1 hypothetical protein [Acinetobacter baumannii]HEM6660740.1 hypothetical protein [Acinetobacter baumannii]